MVEPILYGYLTDLYLCLTWTFELYCTHPSQYTWWLFGSHLCVISFSLKTNNSDGYQCMRLFSEFTQIIGSVWRETVFSSSVFYLISQALLNHPSYVLPSTL